MVRYISLMLLLTSCANHDTIKWGDKTDAPYGWLDYCKRSNDVECKNKQADYANTTTTSLYYILRVSRYRFLWVGRVFCVVGY